MKSKVAIVRCDSYDQNEVNQAISSGLELLGGVNTFIKSGEKILLKVNLLVGELPEKCVTTHPAVFRAVAEQFQAAGACLSYGDSPGFGASGAAAKKAGIYDVADELKLEAADFKEGREVFFEEGTQNKKFFIANGVLDCDGLISLPKMKTHGLERFTGAVKNQFGCVVGMRKGEFHVKLPDATDFARMLVDLNSCIKPRLYIMDGIIAMEGNGPRGGTPRPMNVLLFSTDPIALDATASRLINLNPLYVPTTLVGSETGVGNYREEDIELVGDELMNFICLDFNVERSPVKTVKKGRMVQFLNNRLIAKPYILEEKCTRCGTCVQSCPVEGKAVNWLNDDKTKAPVYDYSKCIKCYCCQEMCPESAIQLKEPMVIKVGKLFTMLTLFLAFFILLPGCQPKKQDWNTETWSSGKNLTKIMNKKGVYELSGLHWNPVFNRLYAIQDDGNLRILQLETTTNKFSQIAHIKLLGGPEGVTQVDNNANEFYTIDENSCEIRRYTHTKDFLSVALANKWSLKEPPTNMTDSGNEGPEGIEFVPDSYLKAIGFISSNTNKKCLSTKGMNGLIFIAHQKKGLIWVFDVNPKKTDDFAFVGKYKTDKDESCDLSFDRSTGFMYILHNIGRNTVEVTDLSTKLVSGKYKFVLKQKYDVPNPSGSKNIEGFAISPKFAKNTKGNVWLCRDIGKNENTTDRKDCLRWFSQFPVEGTCVKNWKQ